LFFFVCYYISSSNLRHNWQLNKSFSFTTLLESRDRIETIVCWPWLLRDVLFGHTCYESPLLLLWLWLPWELTIYSDSHGKVSINKHLLVATKIGSQKSCPHPPSLLWKCTYWPLSIQKCIRSSWTRLLWKQKVGEAEKLHLKTYAPYFTS